MARQRLNKLDDAGVRYPTRLSNLVLLDVQPRVIPSLPVDDQSHRVANHVDDDLRDQQSDDLLTRFDGDTGTVPGLR
jgi:hypothetical protein